MPIFSSILRRRWRRQTSCGGWIRSAGLRGSNGRGCYNGSRRGAGCLRRSRSRMAIRRRMQSRLPRWRWRSCGPDWLDPAAPFQEGDDQTANDEGQDRYNRERPGLVVKGNAGEVHAEESRHVRQRQEDRRDDGEGEQALVEQFLPLAGDLVLQNGSAVANRIQFFGDARDAVGRVAQVDGVVLVEQGAAILLQLDHGFALGEDVAAQEQDGAAELGKIVRRNALVGS